MSSLRIIEKEKPYNFTLIFKGINAPSEDLENALFEANCDDALLYFSEQIGYLEFDQVPASSLLASQVALESFKEISVFKITLLALQNAVAGNRFGLISFLDCFD